MKKQLFILTLALFAIGISGAYAQITCPTPRPVECLTSDALHPIAGNPYTYTLNVPTPPGTKSYQWYVTQDPNFMAGGILNSGTATLVGGPLVAAYTGTYNVSTADQNSIEIIWQSFVYDPLAPVFVVINVVNAGATCNTQNLKVYKIEPQIAFTLDLANVTSANTTQNYGEQNSFCIHDVVSATYDATAPEGVIYDYGVDYMYFAVTAANYSTSWMPSIQLNGIDLEETVAVDWAYGGTSTPAAFTAAGSFTLAAGTWTTTTPVLAQAANGGVGQAGECILIRVALDHSNAALNYEGIANETVTLAVNGVTNLAGTPIPDIHYLTGAGCGLDDGFANDVSTQVLLARPDVQSATPGVAPYPNPEPFLIVKP
mgnify:CR=1 FL=1